jgi:hypothetical protein
VGSELVKMKEIAISGKARLARACEDVLIDRTTNDPVGDLPGLVDRSKYCVIVLCNLRSQNSRVPTLRFCKAGVRRGRFRKRGIGIMAAILAAQSSINWRAPGPLPHCIAPP